MTTNKWCRWSATCGQFEKPSNEVLLWVAFVSFLAFTMVQSVVAFIAQSEAMMGDSAAMFVDCFTYGANQYAEREKSRDDPTATEEDDIELIEVDIDGDISGIHTDEITESRDEEHIKSERHLKLRRRHLHLELVPPLISVSILTIVTMLVLHNSIQSLILDRTRDRDEQSEPNLEIMITFSFINVFVDGLNVICFARANHLAGYNTTEQTELERQHSYDALDENGLITAHGEIEEEEEYDDAVDKRVNLNMCSAYTHVFADSMRTVAVLVTTITAEFVPSLTPEVADSSAAVVVSIVIFVSLLPLIKGLCQTHQELKSISCAMKKISNEQDTNYLFYFEKEEDEENEREIT